MISQHSSLQNRSCFQRIKDSFNCCFKLSNVPVVESIIQPDHSFSAISAPPQISKSKVAELQLSNGYVLRNNRVVKKEKWKVCEGSAIYQDQSCSICLGQSANVRLQCRHYFHRSCLWQWHKTKQSCPNCRKITKILSVICDSCQFQSFDQKISQAKREQLLDQFGLHVKHYCDTCTQSLQKKESIITINYKEEKKQKKTKSLISQDTTFTYMEH